MSERSRGLSVVLWAVCTMLLIGCSALWGGNPDKAWKLPVATTAETLRSAADTVEQFDTSPKDGSISDAEWADIVFAALVEARKRAAADAESPNR